MKDSGENWLDKYCDRIIIVILLFTIGFMYLSISKPYEKSIQHTSDIAMEEAKYLRVVYIGSLNCSFSNNDQTHQMVRKLKNYFRSFAHEHGYWFLSTGISVDMYADRGIGFLNRSGPYDEIVAGASWFNLGVYRYVWDDAFPGYAATPQILLTITSYKPISGGRQIADIKREDQLLKRVSGMNEIKELYELTQVSTDEKIVAYLGL